MTDQAANGRRIGVYVCQCGGNISDYVSVDDVVAAVQDEPGVAVARSAMFTCSDATQQEIMNDIAEQKLDGIVVASCSPKLHTFTFREMAKRAGLNPYLYTQVNIREQCSWAHTDDKAGATEKAVRLVRAGIARTRFTLALEPVRVETVPRAVVVGGGVAGMRAALALAEIGLEVVLVEKQPQLGGWLAEFAEIYPTVRSGKTLARELESKVRENPLITVYVNAELVGRSGTFGDYEVVIRVDGPAPETVATRAGAVIVATGFDLYQPEPGEFGYGQDGVLTLPEFKRLVENSEGPLVYGGGLVRSVVYIYCVGSRQPGGNEYCSRYCCAAAIHASLQAEGRAQGAADTAAGALRQYHLYRDIRAYGKYELLYNRSREEGHLYLRFPDEEPPVVETVPPTETGGARFLVHTRDVLTGGTEVAIPADLVVLVTGMVPREEANLAGVLKLPVDKDGFFNEIHPKLRPVETVVDGVFICGACQGPKNSAEAVASGLAAAAQTAALLKRGYAELEPLVAVVNEEACDWCGLCLEACPYEAPRETEVAHAELTGEHAVSPGKKVAVIDKTACKSCGACVPVCPRDAIDLLGYSDAQIRAMIESLAAEVELCPR
ncbi:MAG: FAD-dependent oxidoreductase [Thermoleophilia bacterium]|nr:FAD-dependent oxidoreductase [Thermoleophilia bacterium]